MNAHRLIDTARTLVAGDKGLLAMDESNPTCNKRFARLGVPQTEEARRAYRGSIVADREDRKNFLARLGLFLADAAWLPGISTLGVAKAVTRAERPSVHWVNNVRIKSEPIWIPSRPLS
jgi:hypothetical protein